MGGKYDEIMKQKVKIDILLDFHLEVYRIPVHKQTRKK